MDESHTPRYIVTSVRLDVDLHQRLAETSRRLGVSLNWMLNRIIEEAEPHLNTDLKITNWAESQVAGL